MLLQGSYINRIKYQDNKKPPQGKCYLDNCILNVICCGELSFREKLVLAFVVRLIIGRRGIRKYRGVRHAFINYKFMSEIIGMDRETVKDCVEKLELVGYIKVLKITPKKENRWASLMIELNQDKLIEDGSKISVFNNQNKENTNVR